jgi:hypothetical protein
MSSVDAELQRIAALPGSGRYELAFRFGDGSFGTAVVEVGATGIRAAPASLPPAWHPGSVALAAVSEAVLALHRARTRATALPTLRDVPGGWDVSIGNVVLTDGVPHCLAHGPMAVAGDVFACEICGARAVLDLGADGSADAGRNAASG